jgi:hypothetical protein
MSSEEEDQRDLERIELRHATALRCAVDLINGLGVEPYDGAVVAEVTAVAVAFDWFLLTGEAQEVSR